MTMPEKGTSGGTKTFDVVVTRFFDAPVEEVWKAWKDPAHVMRWWGPTGFIPGVHARPCGIRWPGHVQHVDLH